MVILFILLALSFGFLFFYIAVSNIDKKMSYSSYLYALGLSALACIVFISLSIFYSYKAIKEMHEKRIEISNSVVIKDL